MLLLIKQGAQMDAVGKDGHTSLHTAAAAGNRDLCEALLQSGAKVAARTDLGETPLRFAVRGGFRPCVELLLSFDANLDDVNMKGETGLHEAAAKQDAGIAHMLLELGADTKVLDQAQGRTPLHFSAFSTEDARECAELLSRAGAATNPVDREGNTPLHLAARRGGVKMYKLLLALGADYSVINSARMSALHEGARYGHCDLVRETASYEGAHFFSRTSNDAYRIQTLSRMWV